MGHIREYNVIKQENSIVPKENVTMKEFAREVLNRFRLWFEKNKNCRHCCLTCEYYSMCSDEQCESA